MIPESWSLPELKRWTPLTFLFPTRYLGDGEFWREFDLESWSRSEYEWTQDSWNGVRDFAQRPRETVESGTGDCEDYALAAASWAIAQGNRDVGVAFCWEWPYPWSRHVIAFDEDRVYSSGRIYEKSVKEWTEGSDYVYALRRSIN